MFKEWKSLSWISTSKHEVSFCDRCGNYYERTGRVAIGTLLTIQNNFSFFFNKESTSKLVTKVLAGGGGGTKEKIMRASWNKNVLGSRARMLTPSP